ncbi:uncharacterized protein LOC121404022 [Drosophila obscura]|uniref:uncharacterized protein LOC121404022 n=1 Tax=Drosophila obscura TaxID=7282 RepID=UPI001BB23B2A|nr:uncharacterized protein LOC121404022 [Drosophila obscura]
MSIPRRHIFSVWYSEKVATKKCAAVEKYVFSNVFNNNNYSQLEYKAVNQRIYSFVAQLQQKWKRAHRTLEIFEKYNKEWLDADSIFYVEPEKAVRSVGRPSKEFEDCSLKTKLNKAKSLANEATNEELMLAARVSLYKAGKRNASRAVSLLSSDEEVVAKTIKCESSDPKLPIKFSPEEALAIYIDGRFTKHSYKLVQAKTRSNNANVFPSYDLLRTAKLMCYPKDVKVTDSSAEVPLQCLVDHTVSRIVQSSKIIFEKMNETDNIITAVHKWGCDGSSGHSMYRQGYSEFEENKTDEYMFTICIVPLQINMGPIVIWQNSRPSSTRFCRPIKIVCEKETSSLVKLEVDKINKQILEILPTTFQNFQIQHKFHMTMIDGKIFSVIAESSNQTCGICGATPSVMNNLKSRTPDTNLYQYGLSTLHAWIRCLECILHIAYRLPFEKWQIRKSDKDAAEQHKKHIQNRVKKEMSLLVDIPMPGAGNTNNGNTARRFFQQPTLASEITGVDENPIQI